MNVIEGHITEGPSFVSTGGARFPVAPASELALSGHARLMVVRPEKLAFAPAADAPGALSGVVSSLVYVGDCTRYLVDVEGGVRLIVKVQNRRTVTRVRAGERVGVRLDPADARLLKE